MTPTTCCAPAPPADPAPLAARTHPTEAELRAALAAAVGPVAALQRTPSPQASTATLEAVSAELADGTCLDLLLKSGGRDTPHELAVYRDVLAARGLGTPRLLAGSVASAGWLLVEALPGGPLWQSGDVGSWCEAARWLSRAHHRLAGAADGLRPVAGPAEQQLDRAVRRDPRAGSLRAACDAAAAQLRSAPRTVVHGEAFPSNVLLGQDGRVCLVDWETAGSGPGLLDLAALCIGWPAGQAAGIAAAYAEDRPAGALDLLPAARLLVAVRWLGEPLPAEAAGGGHARRTDWYAEAAAAAELLP